MSRRQSTFPRAAALAALAGLGAALGGCVSEKETTGSVYPNDYRDRHPIALSQGPRSLDIFVTGPAGIDGRQRQDLADYIADHRRRGAGPIVAQVPAGPGTSPGTGRALAAIQAAAGHRITVRHYAPEDPVVAAPIRLTFPKLEARVASKCGQWPQDLGVSEPQDSYGNRQYWNFGCAYQSNFAAQVADPVDLIRPRRETPPDTLKRMHGFDQLRQGTDPSTSYRQDGQNKINQSVGN
ncbi:MAG: CpaD family pilus assembly protein [Methylobacteriaceae bacterium]|nr:CpaD family pilus assembly protein [Methylobacteriaceae bacterium]